LLPPIGYNGDVMLPTDSELLRWLGKASRSSVTLGQLGALLELSKHASVAAMSPRSESLAVSYRQKLDRLEKSLSIGRLTTKVGNSTQVSRLGYRVAAEVRLLLAELMTTSRAKQVDTLWVFGAGEAWIQNVITPTLARWPQHE